MRARSGTVLELQPIARRRCPERIAIVPPRVAHRRATCSSGRDACRAARPIVVLRRLPVGQLPARRGTFPCGQPLQQPAPARAASPSTGRLARPAGPRPETTRRSWSTTSAARRARPTSSGGGVPRPANRPRARRRPSALLRTPRAECRGRDDVPRAVRARPRCAGRGRPAREPITDVDAAPPASRHRCLSASPPIAITAGARPHFLSAFFASASGTCRTSRGSASRSPRSPRRCSAAGARHSRSAPTPPPCRAAAARK